MTARHVPRSLLLAIAVLGCGEPPDSAVDEVLLEEAAPGEAMPLPTRGGAAAPDYLLFEAGPVRPVALTPDGTRLLVANTPDDRLEVFDIAPDGTLSPAGSVVVGMRPVAVAARTDDEVWVVNHLSDSVSVVSLTSGTVTRTLLVGDEPRDIVFAGPGNRRAFVTAAHRGQHLTDASLSGVPGAGDPQLTTAGVGRADVWVFDSLALGTSLGGTPLEIVNLFGDTPRGLAVSPDGTTVYASVLHSGNETTLVAEGIVCNGGMNQGPCDGDGISLPNGLPGGQMPGGNPGPNRNAAGDIAPEVALIVQYDAASGQWRDQVDRNWTNGVRFSLPDLDVFAIDAASRAVVDSFAHVGTTLFNVAVNPANDKVYVTNTEANNLTRFEGPGVHGGSTVQGNIARSRITVIDPGTGAVTPHRLNTHIDYGVLPAPAGTEDHSLATPLELVFSDDGATAYVAAFGSSRVGVIPTADLEAGTFDATLESGAYIDVSGGGPSGLVIHPTTGLIYASTRFDNGVSTLDPGLGTEVAHRTMHTPEGSVITDGRPVLYDAVGSSSNGEAACASCHIFGDVDHLAWDLGNPDDVVVQSPLTIELSNGGGPRINGTGNVDDFHPMKGPMTTQTFRGMQFSGAMHWRGDRSVGFYGTDPLDARLSFKNFIVAFNGLLGDDTPETDPVRLDQMDRFADFALELTMPPNPVRALDNSLTAAQQRGLDFYHGARPSDAGANGFNCDGCHTHDPANGFYGTDGRASVEGEPQVIKIPHLRNLYTRVGMFGMGHSDDHNPGDNGFKGDQIRGFGFAHDGSVDTLFRFFQATVFNDAGSSGIPSDTVRRDLEQLMLAFDAELAPAVGQQVTVRADNGASVKDRVLMLLDRAAAPFASRRLGGMVTECDVVAHLPYGGGQVGLLYDPVAGNLQPYRRSLRRLAVPEVIRYVQNAGVQATFTCVPPGAGVRRALDRDGDGAWDGDELQAGTDPADPMDF